MAGFSPVHRTAIHRPAGHWPKGKAVGTLTLDFGARHRRRIRLITNQGEDVLLDLPTAVAMVDGDGLQLEDGRWLKVQAAAELIVEVRHKDPNQLMRIAWHLGNRHLPAEIQNQVLRIRPDHVIEDMLDGLGADLVKVQAPFQPEGGAYSGRGHHHNQDDSGHYHE
ncbi:MAG: urease accessory protein UreE [Rhodomicrobium sp.]